MAAVGRDSYERLEFLGDRVLGLVVARWLYERFPNEPEGKMARRYNALGRARDLRRGRPRARPSGATSGSASRRARIAPTISDNVVGDVVEALIGACSSTAGSSRPRRSSAAPGRPSRRARSARRMHPKSALQELAADAQAWRRRFTNWSRRIGAASCAALHGQGQRSAGTARPRPKGESKQEAETAAAAALLEQMQ